jgi:hypothetical protein
MHKRLQLLGTVAFATFAGLIYSSGCSANSAGSEFGSAGTGGGGNPDGSSTDGMTFGCNSCLGDMLQLCDEHGKIVDQKDCKPQVCVFGKGCMDCTPGLPTCVGNDIHVCGPDGTPGELTQACDPAKGEICGNGKCGSECDVLAGSGSYVGCEFWAVDLPNERGNPLKPGKQNWAAFAEWGVVLVNAGQTTANVTIDVNNAPYGEPHQIETIRTLAIAPGALEKVVLPPREVTGLDMQTLDPPGPPGTMLASAAFRITSSAPMIVTQFNVFENSYSNDASLLLPAAALGVTYRVLGYGTANPIQMQGMPAMAGIPDHASVTVVGIESGTKVDVKVAADITGNAALGIPAAKKGDVVTVTLGAFDTLNLASRSDCTLMQINQCLGDFTGTIVQSNRKVAVFTSGERAILGPKDGPENKDACCTDHLEEQMFPVESLGRNFIITRSPPRGGTEPDVLRFMGVAATAEVTTTLPAPDDKFTLEPGQMRELNSYKDIAVVSTEPIIIGQILVSQAFTADWIGDPSLTCFPPVEQYRKNYTFLTPPSWTKNYVVLATEQGNKFQLDGKDTTGCEVVPGPELQGKTYQAIRCPVDTGTHTVEGEQPFGITAYGYGPAGSYAFVGGADIKPIYTPPPLL